MPDPVTEPPLRVAYTLEQLWHRVPGGTAVAALRVADALDRDPSVELHLVAGRHPLPPDESYRTTHPVHMLPLARPLLYEAWTRLRWPKVEAVTGPIDVAHATGLVPCATSAPLVVTLHDLAFVHEPGKFTRHGVRLMTRSLDVIRRRAAAVLCSSRATVDDAVEWGIPADRLHHVPLGVDVVPVDSVAVDRVRRRHDLPAEFVLFVGTIEPRKNLARLARAMQLVGDLPLVVAGAAGWGDAAHDLATAAGDDGDVIFLGFVPDDELRALYAAATVFAYPSLKEGFGLPVLEAMAQSTPVVTSSGTSTEEVAGGAAVLVEPTSVDDIVRGVRQAVERRDELADAGRRRADEMTWRSTAERTADVYRTVARPEAA